MENFGKICDARLYLTDDFEESVRTVRCTLQKGHSDLHCNDTRYEDSVVNIKWETDMGADCCKCGDKFDPVHDLDDLCSECRYKEIKSRNLVAVK